MSSSESTLRITHDPSGGTCWIKPPACVGTHNASTATTATGAANSDLLKRTMRSALTRLESCATALRELPLLPQLPPGPSPRFHENGLTHASWYSPPPEKILTRGTFSAIHSGKNASPSARRRSARWPRKRGSVPLGEARPQVHGSYLAASRAAMRPTPQSRTSQH